jgi:hypothetical protein
MSYGCTNEEFDGCLWPDLMVRGFVRSISRRPSPFCRFRRFAVFSKKSGKNTPV